ncbi:MAG TPA: PEP-CTERM sorting domain-containing protein, partial [Isosphaeraceae bacterium]|nr:PEP-CTERM sorting domain-containing protein [Isosphaeraceae bacterium]
GTSVSLNDSASFFSDFNQQFTPGTTLTFTMNSTLVAPPSGGTPDNFSMVILSNYETTNGYNFISNLPPPPGDTPIPTTDTVADTFFNFNINGTGSTTVSSFSSTSGDVSIAVTPTTVVPEPSSVVFVCTGTLGLLGYAWRRRRREAIAA